MVHFDPRVQLPRFITGFYPGALWRGPAAEKQVFLTFDDGPVPEVTPWVLDLLRRENISACFFCVGENVQRHPELYRQILAEGHLAGNHSFNHIQGLKTPDAEFFANIEKAARYIDSPYFRPPHGFLRRSQYRYLRERYQVVMWDVVSRDYRAGLSPEQVTRNVQNFVRPGSVIVFHDSVKAQKNLYAALPAVIQYLKKEGYRFGKLSDAFPEKHHLQNYKQNR